MRYASRVDSNHKEIADRLREAEYSVLSLARLGFDAPDLLVGTGLHNLLFEIKTEKGKLSEGQKEFFKNWRGPKFVVRSKEEALQIASQFLPKPVLPECGVCSS